MEVIGGAFIAILIAMVALLFVPFIWVVGKVALMGYKMMLDDWRDK